MDLQINFDDLSNNMGIMTTRLESAEEAVNRYIKPVSTMPHLTLEATVPVIIQRLGEVQQELNIRGPAPTVNRANCVVCGGEPELVLDCGHCLCISCNTGIKSQIVQPERGRRICPKCPVCRQIYKAERAVHI